MRPTYLAFGAGLLDPTFDVAGSCIQHDPALLQLSRILSPQAAIACRGEPLQIQNAELYWGLQYSKNASVVIYPRTTEDVAAAVKATHHTPLGADYTFVGGGHGMTNASSSYDLVIDLSWMNETVVTTLDVDGQNITAIRYQGGVTSGQVQDALANSGYTAVTARVSGVGMGGFSTGGGIGYLAGAFGFATDRLRAAEVVLPCGDIVFATKSNEYSDLFWALHGGNGQFGIVTTFYQEAAPEPPEVTVGFHFVASDSVDKSFRRTVDFFTNHNDPYSLIYYGWGFLPANPFAVNATPSDYTVIHILATLRITDPSAPPGSQPSYNATFAPLLHGINSTGSVLYDVSLANLTKLADDFFPSGFRRGFWGPQVTNISLPYMRSIDREFKTYVAGALAAGDFPASTTYVLQYMSPGLNGHLPASDADTAWPHSVAGHQTLFDPGWTLAPTDGVAERANDAFNELAYGQQASAAAANPGTPAFLADYPNYVSPGASGRRVFAANLERLYAVKQKYDPLCTLHQGRVLASEGCVERGFATVYP